MKAKSYPKYPDISILTGLEDKMIAPQRISPFESACFRFFTPFLLCLFHLTGKKILGKTSVNQGKKEIISSPTNRTITKGIKGRMHLPISMPAKLQAMKMPIPIGGRNTPMPMAVVTRIQ
jgi:hypothetical protein